LSGGSTDDLVKTWGMGGESHAGLASLAGGEINGVWTVKVVDTKFWHEGDFNFVRLHLAGKH